ncbi:hypothetical protein PAGU2638_07550 [Lysobacter sp. PAGU 2638]
MQGEAPEKVKGRTSPDIRPFVLPRGRLASPCSNTGRRMRLPRWVQTNALHEACHRQVEAAGWPDPNARHVAAPRRPAGLDAKVTQIGHARPGRSGADIRRAALFRNARGPRCATMRAYFEA